MNDLFSASQSRALSAEHLADGAVVLHGKALAAEIGILHDIERITSRSPFRRMTVPGGHVMSVAMTNCGQAGWVSDRSGYRYDKIDPLTGQPWPSMPGSFLLLAQSAASEAGYPAFVPDVCLINRYEPGAKLSLHQDKDELSFDSPIVSVSLGLPATFQFGGAKRTDTLRTIRLEHGDIVVWGGPSRLFYHGILALKDGEHDKVGRMRLNLTFRAAL